MPLTGSKNQLKKQHQTKPKTKHMPTNLAELENKVPYTFKNKDLLLEALTHRSFLNENRSFKLDHNERLEFLGDAVLELIVTEYLFKNFPNPEGDLTNWRAALVNSTSLLEVAEVLELENFMQLSKGEQQDTNSKARGSIIADAVEALIGAIYLDSGFIQAKKFIDKYFIARLDFILENNLFEDPKSKFQELAQEKEGTTPHYKVLEESGPDHAKKFVIGVYLDKELIATGEGSSKQEAQVNAATAAIQTKDWK